MAYYYNLFLSSRILFNAEFNSLYYIGYIEDVGSMKYLYFER